MTLRWSTDRREMRALKQKADHVELMWSTDRRVTRIGSAEPNVSYIHMLDVCTVYASEKKVPRL